MRPSWRAKRRFSDDILKTVSVHLDGVDREAIIHMVTKAMREGGASECEIEGFKDDVNTADLATLLAKAIAWGAPVQFLKDGQPWISGDWRRLSLWQRLKREVLVIARKLCPSRWDLRACQRGQKLRLNLMPLSAGPSPEIPWFLPLASG